jgi:hypothetical protein
MNTIQEKCTWIPYNYNNIHTWTYVTTLIQNQSQSQQMAQSLWLIPISWICSHTTHTESWCLNIWSSLRVWGHDLQPLRTIAVLYTLYTPYYPCVDSLVWGLFAPFQEHLQPSNCSACLYAQNNSRTTGWIFMKSDTREFYKELLYNSNFNFEQNTHCMEINMHCCVCLECISYWILKCLEQKL